MPLFGTGVIAQQGRESFLCGLLLRGQLGDVQVQSVQLLLAMLLVGLFFLDGLLTFLLLGQFIAVVAKLLKTLADVLVQLHEGRCRFAA